MAKKIWGVVLTIALVITTLNYIPKNTEASQFDAAGYDWSTVEYLKTSGDTASFANKYKMIVVEGNANIDVIQNPGFTTAPGIYTTFADADFGSITINDKVTTAYSVQGAGVVFHMEGFTDKYSELIVKNSAGNVKARIYMYYEDGTGGGTVDPETTTVAPTEPDSGVLIPTALSVYNFYAQEKGYQINFTPAEGAVSYNVYLDNGTEAIGTVVTSGEYLSASAFSQAADGGIHTVYLQSVDSEGKVSAKSSGAKVRVLSETNSNLDPSDISRVYVVTNEGTKGGSDIIKATKTPASLTIISADGVIKTVSDGGTIKLRGNSTSFADKKAYNISFNSKKEVISGKSKGKKWCLLANAFEKSLIRNKLAMDFGASLGNIATPEEHYVELYIDGKYLGSYVISEPAENKRSGVEYDDGETSDELLFELEDNDKNEEECLYYRTPVTGVRFVTEDTVDTSSARYQKWVDTLTKFETALIKTESDDVFTYIDVDTFVDMYIVNELFQTVDFGYSSVKFYITYDVNGAPTIHAGPLWDFDLSSGNSSFAENRTYNTMRGQNVNKWFGYLMKNATFKNKVLTKYEQIQPRIQNIYKDNKLGLSQITQNINQLGQSRLRNYSAQSNGGAGWSESTADSAEYSIYPYSYSTVAPYSTYTYDQHIEYLTTWLKNRNEWLCSQWGIDFAKYDSEYGSEVISTDISITGYQISSSYNGIDGNMGFRTIYQAEPVIEGKTPMEVGIIYGLVYGNTPISQKDVLYGSANEYVKSYAATEAGKLNTVMGTSDSADYYARTMAFEDGLSADAYISKYYIRAYARFSDNTVVYSDVKSYTVYKVADYVYQNNLASTKNSYDYIYNKILKKVNADYIEGDFNWSGTLVK